MGALYWSLIVIYPKEVVATTFSQLIISLNGGDVLLFLSTIVMKEWKDVEMPRIELGTFHMRSERSTTELHPLLQNCRVSFWQNEAELSSRFGSFSQWNFHIFLMHSTSNTHWTMNVQAISLIKFQWLPYILCLILLLLANISDILHSEVSLHWLM